MSKKKEFVVYKISLPNGKQYIGITFNFKLRKYNHLYDAFVVKNKRPLYRAIRKYGEDSLKWRILKKVNSWEIACEEEKKFILKYKTYIHEEGSNGYNLTKGGDGSLGALHSEETKRKISEMKKGLHAGEENPNFGGKHQTDEVKKKMSKNRSGKPAYRPGWRHTEESKRQVAINKGSREFLVFNKETFEYVGSWINKAKCAEDLKIKQKAHIGGCLRGERHTARGYVFIHLDEDNFDEKLKELLTRKNDNHRPGWEFDIFDSTTGDFIKRFYSAKQCCRELGLNEKTLGAKLKNGAQEYKGYLIKNAVNTAKKK